LVKTSSRSNLAVGSYELAKSRDSTRDNFGTPTWESREKEPFGCSLGGALQRILYGGRWWLPPSPGRGESCVSKCPWLVPTPKGVPECELTLLWLVLDAPLPLSSAGSRERLPSPNFSQLYIVEPSSGFNPGLGSVSKSFTTPELDTIVKRFRS
jgi:hypothetical protein